VRLEIEGYRQVVETGQAPHVAYGEKALDVASRLYTESVRNRAA